MKTRAAVALGRQANPLEIELLDLEGPKQGEVLLRNVATGVCHTDAFTLSGEDPEGIFPAVLGHEGGAIVEEVGDGVSSVTVGDHVIPLYTPECGECSFCTSGKTNLCQAIRATQGQGLMPDGTSRFSAGGKTVYHYMGTSTFSEYTVIPEIRGRQSEQGRTAGKSLFVGLRHYDRHRGCAQHGAGRTRCHCRGIWARRSRPKRDPGSDDGESRANRRG